MKKAEEKDVGILVRVPEASGILTGKVMQKQNLMIKIIDQ